MAKELKILNSNFFDLFYKCQKRGVLSFTNESKKLRNLTISKNDYTDSYYKRIIIQKIIMTTLLYIKENKKISYSTFTLISKSILKEFLNKKENDLLESPFEKNKKSTNKMILLSQIEDNLKLIFNFIIQEDCLEIKDGNIEEFLELNDYIKERIDTKFKFGTCMKFMNTYMYKVEIPFLTLNDNNELSVIYFINDIDYYNPPNTSIELSLISFFISEYYKDFTIKNFILYDTTSFKRIVFPIYSLNEICVLDELFRILVLLEYKNITKSKGKNCKECLNSSVCVLETMTQEKHTIFHKTIKERYGNINGFKTNKLVKDKLLKAKALDGVILNE